MTNSIVSSTRRDTVDHTVAGIGTLRVALESVQYESDSHLHRNIPYSLQKLERKVKIETKSCCFHYVCPCDDCFIVAIECYISGLFSMCCPAKKQRIPLAPDPSPLAEKNIETPSSDNPSRNQSFIVI